jgi:hypothetical protein
VRAQNDSTNDNLSTAIHIDGRVINGLQKQYISLQSMVAKQSFELLSKMQRRENKLHAKLNTIDSIKANELFADYVKQKYQDLQSGLTKTTEKFNHFPLEEYIPGLDSMQTCLHFLMTNPNLTTNKLQEVQVLTSKLKDLEGQFQKANEIQSFIREREAALKDQLMNFGLDKQLLGINKQVYYYQAELAQCKELLNDKEKLKEKLLETVRTLPAFQKFWQKNSYLTALFPVPENYGTSRALAGLQTRASVQDIVAQRIGTTGIDPQQYFQGQVNAAQAQLNQLKNKLNQFYSGSGSSDMATPDFNPNDERTRSFFKRVEYGFNIQSQPGQYYLPATSDIALTLGYKLSDNKRFGLGASYKIGWGNGFKNIRISSEGAGLRSYVDIKAKGSIWLSGGFEYNYLSGFRSLQDLHNNINAWQRSALMGISKKYKIGKKEGSMQLLYDFLHHQQNPPSTALKFRVGYTL